MESKLYVGNLSYSTTEDDLRTLFFQAGTVSSVALIKDRDSGQSKGFAFVEMSSQSEAQKAITMFNGFNMGDRELKVSMAKPREERSGGFGGDRGGNRGGSGGATVLSAVMANAINPFLLQCFIQSPRCRSGRFFIGILFLSDTINEEAYGSAPVLNSRRK
jgi:RNA recognition motif-containing protein